MVESEPASESFRFVAKKALLTYAAHLPKEDLATYLKRKFKGDLEVKICHEVGDTGHQHTHVAFITKRKPDFKDARCFDFEGHHPNIRVPRDASHWKEIVKYLDKQDDDVYGHIEVKLEKGDLLEASIAFVKQCSTWREVLQCSDMNMLMCISGKLQFFQQIHTNLANARVEKPKHKLTDFNVDALDITKPTLLWGVSGAGKTEFALAHFNKPLFISNIDDLNKFQEGYHDGLVFDDIDFSHFPPTAIIHLCDINHTRTIKCRYQNAVIPQGTPRIFTSNVETALTPMSMNSEQRIAIQSRLYTQYVGMPLYNRPN